MQRFETLFQGAVAAGAQGLTGDLSQLQGVGKAGSYLGKSMLTLATTNALHATLEGRSIGDAAWSGLQSGALDGLAAYGANGVGDVFQDSPGAAFDKALHYGSHALLGCAKAQVQGGKCGAGAAGGASGEMLGEFFGGNGVNESNIAMLTDTTVQLGAIFAGADQENIAASTGAAKNAVENNWKAHYLGGAVRKTCDGCSFTFSDAKEQWQKGQGGDVTEVNTDDIDWSNAEITYTSKNGNIGIQTHDLRHGNVTASPNPDGTYSLKPDVYDFDTHGGYFGPSAKRNIKTTVGKIVNNFYPSLNFSLNGRKPYIEIWNPGTPYRIFFNGNVPVNTMK